MKKKNIKLILQYDGTRYRGWQRLGDSGNTIQGKVEAVLARMTDEKIELIGSGRTDAGAHAYNQVANFKTASPMTSDQMLAYCYQYLPDDIVVKSLETVDDRFHARYNARSKTYLYRLCTGPRHDVFERKYAWHIPQELDIGHMREAARHLLGNHDFQSFTSLKSKKKSMERELFSIEIMRDGCMVDMYFNASGFLHNMVRIIAGTLVDVGAGRIVSDAVGEILASHTRSNAGLTAPPHGLFLYAVEY